ncbi:uncharacterized protein [Rutidosis leptorrhynchoides]|uniref:uncharacterized protein n=1 Tax=Rutidosis leptorrhynchoides TaxID=125765 RepID=UPI003A99EF4D
MPPAPSPLPGSVFQPDIRTPSRVKHAIPDEVHCPGTNTPSRNEHNGFWTEMDKVGRCVSQIRFYFYSCERISNCFWVKLIKSIYERDGGLGGTSHCRIEKEKYPRLYRLEEDKGVTIFNRVKWINEEQQIEWNWSRALFGRALNDVQNLQQEVAGLIRNNSSEFSDGWLWKTSDDGNYYTKTLANILGSQLHGQNNNACETNMNKLAPKSLGIFVWRAKRRRLPVRVELDNRGIDLHTVCCPMCDDDVESTDHALVLCKFAFEVWESVYRWWGFGNFSSTSINELFNGESNSIVRSKARFIWQAMEWVCGYIIWKNRNQKVFHNNIRTRDTLLNDIQIKSFEWISRREKKVNIEWHQWLINPSSYGGNRSGVG